MERTEKKCFEIFFWKNHLFSKFGREIRENVEYDIFDVICFISIRKSQSVDVMYKIK